MSKSRGKSLRTPGQALVEFALVAPLLFLVMLALIEFGRFVYYNHVLNDATREGARYAIVHGSDDEFCPSGPMPGSGTAGNTCDPYADRVKNVVYTFAVGVIRGGDFLINVDYPNSNNARGSAVDVRVDYTYRALLPLVPLPSITISAESRLVINH